MIHVQIASLLSLATAAATASEAASQTPSTGLQHPSSNHCHNWLLLSNLSVFCYCFCCCCCFLLLFFGDDVGGAAQMAVSLLESGFLGDFALCSK